MKTMPILISNDDERAAWTALDVPLSVPWEMVSPHEKQADENHSQTLARLAERGGLAPCELIAVLEDRDWRRMTLAECAHRLRFFQGKR